MCVALIRAFRLHMRGPGPLPASKVMGGTLIDRLEGLARLATLNG